MNKNKLTTLKTQIDKRLGKSGKRRRFLILQFGLIKKPGILLLDQEKLKDSALFLYIMAISLLAVKIKKLF